MKGSLPASIQSTFPPHPFLQHFSQGNSTGAGCPAPAKGHGTGQYRCSSQAEHKPSCGQLAHVSIQVPFLNEDQETYGLTPLICLCEAGPGEPRLVQFFTYAKLHSPKPTVPPNPSPHYPELYEEQFSILTTHSHIQRRSYIRCHTTFHGQVLPRSRRVTRKSGRDPKGNLWPGCCDQQDKLLWPQKRLMPRV